ncbi:MAG: bacillithiol system redox-active protein YtxJ [Bacteroidota bacterium]
MNWHPITSEQAIQDLIDRSRVVPCLIFKHSTRCPISSIAKMRLEDHWDFGTDELEPYYLDLIAYRQLSNMVAQQFSVAHESPQVLLIRDGHCTYDSSHLDIQVAELHECYQDT